MSDRRRPPDRLATLLDVGRQLRVEQAFDPQVLRRRDRGIARDLVEGDRRDPWRRADAWLEAVGAHGPVERIGPALEAGRRTTGFILAVLAAFAGASTSAAVYAYDGRHPVNVLWALGIFVLLPLVLMTATTVSMLPEAARRRVPGLAALQDGLLSLNPSRAWALLLRWLPDRVRGPAGEGLGLLRSEWLLYGRVQRWLLLSLAQGVALCFQLAAIAGFLALTFLTDLAFGWSTTLEIEPATLAAVVQPLAWPFGWLVPDAVPSSGLIESTRYYRLGAGVLAGAPLPAESAAALGGWWPFLAASMICYGVLPRLVLWAVARRRLRASLDEALERTPGYASLVDRLEAPLVETGAHGREAAPPAGADRDLAAAPEQGACVVIDWAAVGVARESIPELVGRHLGLEALAVHDAGGECSPQQDARVVEAVAAAPGGAACVVLVRAWEPPVLEFLDFLRDLRSSWGDAHPVLIVPVSFGADGRAVAPDAEHVAEWRRKLRSSGDPWLSLRPLVREAA